MAKHTAPSTVGWGQRILMGLVALLVVVAGYGAYTLLAGDGPEDDSPGTAAGVGDGAAPSADGGTAGGDVRCGRVTIWSAPEVLPAVTAAAERARDDCFTYSVVTRGTAVAQAAVERGELPDAWIPSSTAWATLAASGGAEVTVGEVLASSPVMLASTPETVQAMAGLGIGAESTWPEVLTIYRELLASGDAPVDLRVGDPRVDAASLALVNTVSGAVGGVDDPESPVRDLLVVLAQNAVQGDVASAVRSVPSTLVPLTEQQLADAAEKGLQLQGLPLESGAVQVPFVRGREAVSPDAVDALEQQLVSDAGRADLAALGLRPGADGAAPGVAGVPANLTSAGAGVDPAEVAAVAETWSVIAPESRILTLIDISGSMEAQIGRTTRIDLTREAAQTALSVIPGQTEIGLWYFSTALDGRKDYRAVVPLRPLDEELRGVTQRDLLMTETANLGLDILEGDTGLHDALWAGYKYMRDNSEAGSISSVLLLTDGINDDSTGGLSDEEVVALLEKARDAEGGAPVTVVLIGVGPDVDEAGLQRLAEAAGGEAVVIRDPRELPQVFVDVVASRAQ